MTAKKRGCESAINAEGIEGIIINPWNRTIMLDSGEIILDISKEQREKMNVEDLLKMYSEKKQKQFDNDRILLG